MSKEEYLEYLAKVSKTLDEIGEIVFNPNDIMTLIDLQLKVMAEIYVVSNEERDADGG